MFTVTGNKGLHYSSKWGDIKRLGQQVEALYQVLSQLKIKSFVLYVKCLVIVMFSDFLKLVHIILIWIAVF